MRIFVVCNSWCLLIHGLKYKGTDLDLSTHRSTSIIFSSFEWWWERERVAWRDQTMAAKETRHQNDCFRFQAETERLVRMRQSERVEGGEHSPIPGLPLIFLVVNERFLCQIRAYIWAFFRFCLFVEFVQLYRVSMRRYKTGKNLSLPTYPFIVYLAGQIAENEKKSYFPGAIDSFTLYACGWK